MLLGIVVIVSFMAGIMLNTQPSLSEEGKVPIGGISQDAMIRRYVKHKLGRFQPQSQAAKTSKVKSAIWLRLLFVAMTFCHTQLKGESESEPPESNYLFKDAGLTAIPNAIMAQTPSGNNRQSLLLIGLFGLTGIVIVGKFAPEIRARINREFNPLSFSTPMQKAAANAMEDPSMAAFFSALRNELKRSAPCPASESPDTPATVLHPTSVKPPCTATDPLQEFFDSGAQSTREPPSTILRNQTRTR